MSIELVIADIARGIRSGDLLADSANLETNLRGILTQHPPRLVDCHHPVVADGECVDCGARLRTEKFE